MEDEAVWVEIAEAASLTAKNSRGREGETSAKILQQKITHYTDRLQI